MRRFILAGLISVIVVGCASNKASEEPGARIHDTTMTARDSASAKDTLPHIRDTVRDSAQR